MMLLSLGPEGSGGSEGPVLGGRPVVGAQVIDPGRGNWQSLRFKDTPELRLYGWSCEPSALGLPVGELALLPDPPEEAPQLLPRPIGDYLLQDGGAWVTGPGDSLRGLLRHLPFVEPSACRARGATFLVDPPTALALPEGEYPTFAITLGNGQVVIGTTNGQLLGVKDNGVPQLLATLTTSIATAAPKGTDELWLLGRDGILRHGRPGGPLEAVTATIGLSGATFSVMAGSGPDEETELFLVTGQRKFARFDGQRWTTLSRGRAREWNLGGGFDLEETLPTVIRLGPGHALTYGVTQSDQVVVEWRDGQIAEHRVGLPPRMITGVVNSRAGGWVAGAS